MSTSIGTYAHRSSQPMSVNSSHNVRRQVARWLLRSWEAACRRAERPTRFVPRY
ncbi:MAG TPA: hypothetical protein VFU71_21545 [Burkholderiaceae bacterium]|nr:hypothetical protein [Burkholderiaceae bacterium]